MSSVAGHQPNLYPYAGFFAKLASVDKFVIADNTQYVKKEYHNRNRVRLTDGKIVWLSIPVKNSGRYCQKINEAEIDNTINWQRKHESTLLRNYKKAPFFDLIFPQYYSLYNQKWEKLSDFNIAFIKLTTDILGIKTPILFASELGVNGKATEYILDICKKSDCDCYMHGKHAYDYVDFSLLEFEGIQNIIQSYSAVEYTQFNLPFIPNLSVLDLLFHCGNSAYDVIMAGHSEDVRMSE